MIAAHADWSLDPRKRWVTLARRQGREWQASAPRMVGDPATLAAALIAEGAPAALGLDLPLGVPRGFAETRPEQGFPAFLAGLAGNPDFFEVSPTLETVSPARPFYPARGIKGMTRAAHAAALGLADASGLSRLCDRATAERPAGAPVVWTLGANGLPPRLLPVRPYAFGPLWAGCMICSAPASLLWLRCIRPSRSANSG
jgi:hypothetical protein